MDQNATIKVENLTKIYKLYDKPIDRLKESLNPFKKVFHKNHYALKNVSFDIIKGETLGIIGNNGAGKSTLLKILTGVANQTSGDINITGRISALLELGTGFNPELTGIENIFFSGMLMGATKEYMNKNLNKIIQFADIGVFIDQAVKTYSSGMFSRLAFAVAIHVEPDILIVDEALAVGDLFFQVKCNMFMKENMGDITKILVSHDLGTIAKMADKVLLLDKGELIYFGETSKGIELYTKNTHSKTFQQNTDLNNNNPESKKLNDEKLKTHTNWLKIPDDSMGGGMKIYFNNFSILVNEDEYSGLIKDGDIVNIAATFTCKENIKDAIFGYFLNDKNGTPIFGENTVTSNFQNKLNNLELKQGEKGEINFSFDWPEIHEGDYFLVIGIGTGKDSKQHEIQCWAHNIFQFCNITHEKDIHGVFNNKIKYFEIKKY